VSASATSLRAPDWLDVFPADVRTGVGPFFARLLTISLEQAVRELERILITGALVSNSNKMEAARVLQCRRQQLYARMADLGLD
jgi:DNA-binding NtrC family response regulator